MESFSKLLFVFRFISLWFCISFISFIPESFILILSVVVLPVVLDIGFFSEFIGTVYLFISNLDSFSLSKHKRRWSFPPSLFRLFLNHCYHRYHRFLFYLFSHLFFWMTELAIRYGLIVLRALTLAFKAAFIF